MEQIMLIQNRTGRTEAEMLRNFLIENNIDISICRICQDKNIKPFIHHIDGNPLNNNLFNLVVLCSLCHFAMHFKPHLLVKRNKTIIKELITGKPKSEEHKRKISIAKKDKTYEEIYGKEGGILKKTKHSNFMKNWVNTYQRDKFGKFIKK